MSAPESQSPAQAELQRAREALRQANHATSVEEYRRLLDAWRQAEVAEFAEELERVNAESAARLRQAFGVAQEPAMDAPPQLLERVEKYLTQAELLLPQFAVRASRYEDAKQRHYLAQQEAQLAEAAHRECRDAVDSLFTESAFLHSRPIANAKYAARIKAVFDAWDHRLLDKKEQP